MFSVINRLLTWFTSLYHDIVLPSVNTSEYSLSPAVASMADSSPELSLGKSLKEKYYIIFTLYKKLTKNIAMAESNKYTTLTLDCFQQGEGGRLF